MVGHTDEMILEVDKALTDSGRIAEGEAMSSSWRLSCPASPALLFLDSRTPHRRTPVADLGHFEWAAGT